MPSGLAPSSLFSASAQRSLVWGVLRIRALYRIIGDISDFRSLNPCKLLSVFQTRVATSVQLRMGAEVHDGQIKWVWGMGLGFRREGSKVLGETRRLDKKLFVITVLGQDLCDLRRHSHIGTPHNQNA